MNRKTFIDRYQILAEVAGLERDETSITKFVMDSEIEAKARAYADEHFPKIEVDSKKPEHWHVILTFAQRYDKKASIGTITATMIPYSLVFLVFWSLMLIIWLLIGLPIGPGVELLYTPM